MKTNLEDFAVIWHRNLFPSNLILNEKFYKSSPKSDCHDFVCSNNYNFSLDTTLDSKLTLEVALECQKGQMMLFDFKIYKHPYLFVMMI